MNEEFKSVISQLCTIIAVVVLLYNMCGDIFFEDMSISEAFFKDPVAYLTTLVPLAAGLLLSITNKAKSAYIGRISMRACIEYLVAALFLLLGVLLRFWVIIHFSMITGWDFSIGNQYLVGFGFLIAIAAIEAAIYSSFDVDEILNTFLMCMAANWLILSAVNGYNLAYRFSQTVSEEYSVLFFFLVFVFWNVIYGVVYFILDSCNPSKTYGAILKRCDIDEAEIILYKPDGIKRINGNLTVKWLKLLTRPADTNQVSAGLFVHFPPNRLALLLCIVNFSKPTSIIISV